jgi:hypothetical protein
MTECHIIADRMPAVVHGRAEWRPSEAAHLDSCSECRLEWQLVQAGYRLGATDLSDFDPARVVAAVASRLASVPAVSASRSVPRVGRWMIGIAAAAALVMLTVRLTAPEATRDVVRPEQVAADVAVLHELDVLNAAELESVLETIPTTAGEAIHVEVTPIGELNATDLERVLQSMEE